MPLLIMLTRMNPAALARCAENEAAYNDEMRENLRNGQILDFYAVLGRYDHVIMAHAKDMREAALLSGEIALKMDMTIETLPALRPDLTEEPAGPGLESTGVRQPNPPSPPAQLQGEIIDTPAAETPEPVPIPQRRRTPRRSSTPTTNAI